MSERLIPTKAYVYWVAAWCDMKPIPVLVCPVNDKRLMARPINRDEAEVSDPRWTWHYALPTPEQWEAVQEVIKASEFFINHAECVGMITREEEPMVQEIRNAIKKAKGVSDE